MIDGWWQNESCACAGKLIAYSGNPSGQAPIFVDCPEHKKANRRARRMPAMIWCQMWAISQAAIYAKTQNLPAIIRPAARWWHERRAA